MGSRALRVATIRGIDLRIDASWLVIAALVTWSFWGRFTAFYDRSGRAALVMAVIGAALFFLSVLVHELAHALEAQHRGVQVGGITLFLFGGVTQSKFDVRRPVDEFALTAVGPFTSFVVGAGMALLATGATSAGLGAVAEVCGLIGWTNLALGAFNLIPGAPLDGGRILRAAVWRVTGDRRRSITVAAQAGRVTGAVLIGLGIAQLLLVSGAFVGGVWLAFIGWFLRRAATAELAQARLADVLSGVPARRLVEDERPISPTAPLGRAVERWRWGRAGDVLPVEDERGNLVGSLSMDHVRALTEDERDQRSVGSVMTPVDQLPHVSVDADPDDLFDALNESRVLVVQEGADDVGILTAERLLTAARRSSALGGRGRSVRA